MRKLPPYRVVIIDADRTGSAPAYSLEEAEALFARVIAIAPGHPIALVKGEREIGRAHV